MKQLNIADPMKHKVRHERVRDQQIPRDEIEKAAYPILASEIYGLKETIKGKDTKLRKMDIILDQCAKDDAGRAASSENNESLLRIQWLCNQQASELELLSESYMDTKQYTTIICWAR